MAECRGKSVIIANGTDHDSSSTHSKYAENSDVKYLESQPSTDANGVFSLTSNKDQLPSRRDTSVRDNKSSIRSSKPKPKDVSTISVQTEWTWKDMELLEQYRVREETPELVVEDEKDESEKEYTPPEAVVKIPESQSQEPDESTIGSLPEPILQSVGPPPILQYNPESKQKDILTSVLGAHEQTIEKELKELGVHIHGNFPCEFCGKDILKWPTITEQEKYNPEQLFCCSEYREFVEAVLEMQKEEQQKLDSQPIDIQPHAKARSKRARQLAEERAKTRVWERHLAEQKRLEEQVQKMTVQSSSKSDNRRQTLLQNMIKKSERIKVSVAANSNTIDTVANATERFITNDIRHPSRYRTRSILQSSNALSPVSSASVHSETAIAAKMRTFTYQLSNLKFVEEGWTLQRPPDFEFSSDDETDDEDEQILVPRQISTSAIKRYEKPLVQRFYRDGSKACILFPNAFSDEPYSQTKQLAQFDPFGNGYCNFINGDLRLHLTAIEGIELNSDGSRRKRWNWWSSLKPSDVVADHVHAPPFQPILFHLNEQMVIKICSQEKIYLTFSDELVDLKFKVGAKLKVNNVNNLPSPSKIDPMENFLKKKNVHLTRLLKNIQMEAQQYVKSQESPRILSNVHTQQISLSAIHQQQQRLPRPMKNTLFPPIKRNEEKTQANRKIYRSIIVT
ncbi:unnamed protein product [Didymodactylos carnosus]|uniref:FAM194 C-terminal domain-containing protein n=2 Tax=Didymodactylos carnosus TaxID=1234261 RepID=A0A813R1A3_9BILA|nr:unnamed protein product [Didymodactylos carnosus]CAF3558613.1 unnamed protein product [Didymodactylos carnosus]